MKLSAITFFCAVVLLVYLTSQTQGAPIVAYVTGNSHDDVGWLNTTQEYYEYAVRFMFDNTVALLAQNKSRKFNYCEIAFFSMWWNDTRTTDTQRNTLKQLLADGQIEFASGGWVMNDEGNPTYSAIIDQMTEGHQFIKNLFGFVPQTTWQIDPSGLTSAMPTLVNYAQMKGHLIDRVSYDVREELIAQQKLEFIWQPSPSLNHSIFTHVLWALYCDIYQEFSWNENMNNTSYIAQKAEELVQVIMQRSKAFLTNNVLLPWVCDFQFTYNAAPNFYVMDQLIDYINSHPQFGVEIKYALVSEYFDAVLNSGVKFPVLGASDFLPYHVEPNGWRTGFYTSRPQFKYNVRQSESILKSVEGILASNLMVLNSGNVSSVYALRKAAAEVQHHDAVVGTMRDYVLASYNEDLAVGQEQALKGAVESIQMLVQNNMQLDYEFQPNYAPLLNISNEQAAVVVLYNSLGWARTDFIKIPVNRNDLYAMNGTNSVDLPSEILEAKEYNAPGKFNMFIEVALPALGYTLIFVSPKPSGSIYNKVQNGLGFNMQSTYYNVSISNATGRVEAISSNTATTNLDQNLLIYHSYEGSAMQMSDPYFMQVTGPAIQLSSNNPSNQYVAGQLVKELYQAFSSNETTEPFAKQIIRLYSTGLGSLDSSNFIEIYHEIGVLPGNRELITQFASSIDSGDTWFTDENAYEYMQRTRNTNADQPIPANYYPSIYISYIEDSSHKFVVVGDRTHSLSSQFSGSLQVMLHRRIVTCPCEIGQPLNDTDIATPTLRLILQNPKESTLQIHKQGYLLNFPPLGFSTVISNKELLNIVPMDDWIEASPSNFFSLLSKPLPNNIHLLSFKALEGLPNQFIFRLTHIFAVGEDAVYSAPVTIDIAALFAKYKILKFTESSLTANQGFVAAPLNVTLNCKEIKTYLIQFAI